MGALGTALTLTLVPELSIGLYAMSPDLPLAAAWLGALALAALALRSEPRSFRALWATLGAGVLVGVACLAKLSGLLLASALLATTLTKPVRHRWRTLAPWSGLLVALVLISPVLLWEARQEAQLHGRGDPTRGWMLLTLSIATSIDALAVGASMALMQQVSVWLPAVVIGVVAAVFSALGITFGARLGSRWSRWSQVAGGVILILIGARIVVSHIFE